MRIFFRYSLSYKYKKKVISVLLLEINFKEKYIINGLPWWLSGKEPPANAGDQSLIPRFGRFSGEGNGNPLQHSCSENPMDRSLKAIGCTELNST